MSSSSLSHKLLNSRYLTKKASIVIISSVQYAVFLVYNTMTYPSSSSLATSPSWEDIALANAMRHVSISAPTLQRRDSNESAVSPMQMRRTSCGWGNQTTRQTYRNDLCSLSQHNMNVTVPVNHQQLQSLSQPSVDYFSFDL